MSVAMSAGLAECFHCFPYRVPPDATPCKVLVEGTWVDGFLLRWLRLPDGRWQGCRELPVGDRPTRLADG